VVSWNVSVVLMMALVLFVFASRAALADAWRFASF